jgi:rod shape-determining protein MreC
MRFATCAVLSFLCISIDHSNDHLATIRSGLSVFVYPIQYAVNVPLNFGSEIVARLRTRRHLIEDNQKLKKDNLVLSSKAQRYAALGSENARLRELLNFSSSFEAPVTAAGVLAIETTPSAHQIVINKGKNQGVYLGQPVLDVYGVIGQVVQVGPFSSTALLITDPKHALPVMLNRSGLRSMAIGSESPDLLLLSFVSATADVLVGDLVTTSGLGRRFPAGYPVGEVSDVLIELGAKFATISVSPTALGGHSREVLLVGRQSESTTERERNFHQ